MGACREGANIWRYFRFNKYSNIIFFIRYKKYKSPYFWHDSFGIYWNRLIGCKLAGHKKVKYLSDGGCSNDSPMHYCFACEKQVYIMDKIK
jgi:hypothetical protein